MPRVLSFMATGSFAGDRQGINDVQAQFEEKYGPGDYRPNIPATYWTFRIMMGAGVVMLLVSVARPLAHPQGTGPEAKLVWNWR